MSAVSGVRRVCRTYWFRLSAVCVAAALFVTSLLAMFSASSVLTTLQHALVHSAVLGGLAGLTMPRVFRRVRGPGLAAQWSITLGALVSLAVAGTAIACGVLVLVIAPGHRPFAACFASDFWINALLTAALGVGMTLYESQRERLATVSLELRTKELEHERAHKMALEARLTSLESRVQPHFLFNTLNAISELIHEDPDQAERIVERLAALLRFSLDAAERGLVPLADELKIVVDYLEIEKARLGDRIAYVIDADPAARRREIPPLSVQTLVENSVKHAIAPRPGGGRVRVEASVAGDDLVIAVWDDGPGFSAAAIREGHGLDNLQARLSARFGSTATVDVGRRDGGTLVTLSVPGLRRPVAT
jgi:two-component system sensor histidine kinase AlgZ